MKFPEYLVDSSMDVCARNGKSLICTCSALCAKCAIVPCDSRSQDLVCANFLSKTSITAVF